MKHFFTLLGFVLTCSGLFGQQLISVFHQHKENGTMQDLSTDTYAYYPDGNLESMTKSLVTGNYYSRKTYTYDNNGNVLTEIHQIMDEQAQAWVNDVQYATAYDASGKAVIMTMLVWMNNNWTNNSQTIYTYDTSGFLTLVEVLYWEAGTWALHEKYVLTNDAQGNVTQSVNSHMENGVWAERYRETFTYNAAELMETGIREDNYNGTWYNSSKSNFSYNANGLPTEILVHGWEQNTWQNSDKIITTYNPDQTKDVLTWQYWHHGAQEWRDSSRSTYTYQIVVTGLEENTISAASIYPNPAHDVAFVKFESETNAVITLLDLNGKVLQSTSSSGTSHKVSLEGIPSGIYLLSAESKGQKQITRIVKE